MVVSIFELLVLLLRRGFEERVVYDTHGLFELGLDLFTETKEWIPVRQCAEIATHCHLLLRGGGSRRYRT